MIDLAELREVLDGAEGYEVLHGAFDIAYVCRRTPSGEPQIIRNLDDRHPEDRLLLWALDHLGEVLAELEAVREVSST